MSKFKNKKALTLTVGAIMAGVSVIGVVAACAPTKAKPAKPTEKKVEQPQTGGSESSKQGSGSTSTDTKQGLETGGTSNPSGGSNNTTKGTTQPSTPQKAPVTNPGAGSNKDKGSTTESTKPENPGNQGKQDSNGGSTSKNDKEAMQGDNPGAGNGAEAGKQEGSPGANGETGKEGKTDPETNGSQNGESTENAKNKELEDKKKEVKDKIGKLTSLSPEEVQKFNGQVDAIEEPKDIAKVDDVLKAAEQKDKEEAAKKEALEQLKAKKNSTKEEIKKLISLSSEKIQEYNNEVDTIEDPKDITKIDEVLKRAEKEALEQLKVKKNDANDKISKLEHLPSEDMQKSKEAVEAVVDPRQANKVDEALKAAEQKHKEIQLSRYKVSNLQFENTYFEHQGKRQDVKQLRVIMTAEDKFIKELVAEQKATITLKSSLDSKTNFVFKLKDNGVFTDTNGQIEIFKTFAPNNETTYNIDTIEIFDGKKTWLGNLENKKLSFTPKTYNNRLYKFA